MANIPTINRTLPLYSRMKPDAAPRVDATPASGESRGRHRVERRRHGERRRKNIQVMFERRGLKDRRGRRLAGTGLHGPDDGSAPGRGRTINTTA